MGISGGFVSFAVRAPHPHIYGGFRGRMKTSEASTAGKKGWIPIAKKVGSPLGGELIRQFRPSVDGSDTVADKKKTSDRRRQLRSKPSTAGKKGGNNRFTVQKEKREKF